MTKVRRHDCTIARNVPFILLHGGPKKTGTTSLQDFLACNSDYLSHYNTHFLGKVNPGDVKSCKDVPKDFVRPMVQYKSVKGMKQLKKELESHVSRGQNVILSDESFLGAPHLIYSLLNSTLQYNVYPLVAYRRYHEWIVSLYKYIHQPHWYNINRWKQWDKRTTIPTFREFLRSQENESHPSIQQALSLRESIFKARGNGTVATCTQVLNLHNQSDVLEEFISLLMKGLDNTNISSSPTVHFESNINSGKSFAVDSEILALKLKKEGFVHESFARRTVVQTLQRRMEALYHNSKAANNNNATIAPPMDCPSADEEAAFLRKSIEAERALLSAEFVESPRGLDALLQSFDKARDKNAYCNVMLDEILKDPAWGSFLACLKKGEECE